VKACAKMVNRFLTWAMRSRLSPLIVRRVGPHAAVAPWPATPFELPEQAAEWLADLRLFATGWVGGLVVFGTFFA
jgi:hypothetical protein